MRLRPVRLLLGVFLLAIVGGGLILVAQLALFAMAPAKPGGNEPLIVEIRKGEGSGEVAKRLAALGTVTDIRRFVWLGRFTRDWKKVKAGEYQVSAGMTPLEILRVITSGISINHPITLREGENIYELAKDLDARGLVRQEKFLELCRDPKFIASLGLQPPLPPSLEGYLFPETYFLNRTLPPEEVLRQMVRKLFAFWTPAQDAQAAAMGMTRHQILTLASIVEKETGAPSERPMIASVFHNRLKKRMRLQSDPTTIYGVWEKYQGNIRRQDLAAQNPYNTYAIPALPVGPISNPGKEAIQATLQPAQTDYLFFVSHNDGTHEFTRNFEDHTRAVRKFQLDPSARKGKSWRDLKKAENNAMRH